jgi:hypothetical protein
MSESLPLWLTVHTRRVLSPFIGALARSHRWNILYIISPWISSFNSEAGVTFEQMLKRLSDDDATAYVVTRPPTEEWHRTAVRQLAETNNASIKFVEALHTKLYCAGTAQGDLALVSSANFTQHSLENREIGVLIRSIGDGVPLIRKLKQEAAEIYRMPGAQTYCQRKLRRR